MADPLSVSASVAGLITLADVVIGRTCKYIKAAKSAAKDATRLIKEVQSLLGILRGLHSLGNQIEDAQLSTHIPSDQIHHCEQTLKKIQNKLASSDPAAISGPLRKLERTLKWPFTSSETEEIFGDLSRYKDTFDLTINMDILETLLLRSTAQDQAFRDVKQIKSEVHELCSIQVSKERRKILDFFMIPGVVLSHRMNLKLRYPGTGRWLTSGAQFDAWLGSRNARMWLYGIPGAGKSVLAAAVISEVLKQASSSFAIAYIYCDYKESKTQQSTLLFAGLAAQLARQHERCFDLLQTTYKAASGPMGQHVLPEAEELLLLIRQMADCFDDVAILIDGLDECEDAGQVASMLAELADNSNIKVMLFSRDERNISLELEHFEHVEISAQKDDLQLYVAAEIEIRLQRRRLSIQSTELKEMILDRLVRDAAGMFRWVACQIDHLCDLPDDAARRVALDDLPIGLDATYERILLRLSRKHERVQTLVERVLKWLVRDQRHIKGLNGCQLRAAVAVNEGDEIFNPEAMPTLETILFHCSSLVRLSADETSLEPAHFTVTQFLRAIDPTSKHSLARYSCEPDQVNRYRAKTCLTFLLSKQFQGGSCKDFSALCHQSKDLPFYHHAAGLWPYYTGARNVGPDEMELLQSLFMPQRTRHFEAWAQMFGVVTIGLPLSADTNAKDDRFEQFMRQTSLATTTTPLQYASLVGQMQTVDWLLRIGCDIGVKNLLGSPLYCAIVGKGAFGVVTSDEDENEDGTINELLRTRVENTFLGFHFHESWTDIIRTLVAQGADTDFDIEYEGKGSRSIMSLAVERDCADVMLQSGVRLDQQTLTDLLEDYTQPSIELQNLIENISDDNAAALDPSLLHELKLRQGVASASDNPRVDNLESREVADRRSTMNQQADLHYACEHNDIAIMEYLLREFPLDVNTSVAKNGLGLLHEAVKNSQVNVIRCLLKYRADVNKADNDGNTPIHLYFKHCDNIDILKILLFHGADIYAESRPGREDSAFQHCIDRSDLQEFSILLEKCANLDQNRINGSSIWHAIAQKDKVTHYKLLRERLSRPDLDSALSLADNDGLIPLHAAAKSGSQEMLDLLMEDTPDKSVSTKDGRNIVHFASSCVSSAEPMRRICQSGIKLDSCTIDGSTALHCCLDTITAAGGSHSSSTPSYLEDVIRLLVDCRSIVTVMRHDKTTAMHLLCRLVAQTRCYRGSGECKPCRQILSVFELLLAGGSDLTQGDEDGKSSIYILLKGLRRDGIREQHPLAAEICCMAVDEFLGDYLRNLQIEGLPPLNIAASVGAEHLCWKLINLGADVDFRAAKTTLHRYHERDAHSPLEQFCIHGCGENLSKALLAKSNQLQYLHATGKGLLHLVAERKESMHPSIKQLVEAGLDVEVRSAYIKATPLMLAAAGNHTDRVKALLEASAALYAEDNSGLNALSWACSSGSWKAMKMLVEHGSAWSTSPVVELGKMKKKEITYEPASKYVSTYEYLPKYTPAMAERSSTSYYGYTQSPRYESKRQYPSYSSSYVEPPSYYDTYLTPYESPHGHQYPTSGGASHYTPRQYKYSTPGRPASGRHTRRSQNAEDTKQRKETIVSLKNELVDRIGTLKYHVGPLELAVYHGHHDIAEYLLGSPAYAENVTKAYVGISALFIACWKGDITTARLLVDKGVDLNHSEDCQKLTSLHVAAVKGSEEMAMMLLNAGCSIDRADGKGRTAIDYALKNRHKGIARQILSHKRETSSNAQPSTDLPVWNSPWRLASAQTMKALVEDDEVQLLSALAENGQDINLSLTCGCTPLLFALQKKRYGVAKSLLRLGASRFGVACEASGSANCTAYHIAAEEGERFTVLKALLQDVSRCEFSVATSSVHPLHVAVANRNLKAVRHMLDRYGESLCPRATSDATAALRAKGDTESFRDASFSDADPWGSFSKKKKKKKRREERISKTPSNTELRGSNSEDKPTISTADSDGFIWADDDPWDAFSTSKPKRKSKRQQEAHTTVQQQPNGIHTLACAPETVSWTTTEHASGSTIEESARKYDSELLISLLQRKVRLDGRKSPLSLPEDVDVDTGDTPLHVAARMGYVEAVQALVEAGAGIDSANAGHETPLFLAVSNDRVEAVKFLIGIGANVNSRDSYGRSIAHGACLIGGNLEILQLLHAHAASFYGHDVYGQTLLHIVARNATADMLHFLLECGLDITLVDDLGLNALDLLFEMRVQTSIGYGLNAVLGANPDIASSTILAQLWDERESSHLRRLIKRIPLQQAFVRANTVSAFLQCTPLYLAALRGQEIICAMLCQAEALVNLEGGTEGTPLMAACSHGRLGAVKLLVRLGATMSYTKNGSVISAMNAAQHFPQIVEWLLVRQHTEQRRLPDAIARRSDSPGSFELGKRSQLDLVLREDRDGYLKSRPTPSPSRKFYCRTGPCGSVIDLVST